MIALLLNVLKKHWPLLLTSAVLALLLFRNPFSTRTLIANFEPFPDAFHYTVPPRCFLAGEGWKMCREGVQGVKPSVPPLYGSLLLPIYFFINDPRSFYFVNVGFAFVSVTLLYLISQKITKNQFVQLLVLAIFVTTYHVYWLPTLAMAENLILPTFLATILFFSQKKLNNWSIAAVSTFAGLHYGSKFAGLPIMTGICAVLGMRILFEHFSHRLSLKKTSSRIVIAILPVLTLFLAFSGWKTLLSIFTILEPVTTASASVENQSNSSWFSNQFFNKHLSIYLSAMRGQQNRFLWDLTPLFTPWMAALGWFGLGYGLSNKRWKWISALVLVTSMLQITIISLFYTYDIRYIYTIFPAVLIGIALSFAWLKDLLPVFSIKKIGLVITLLAISLLSFYSIQNLTRIKSQVALNFKYAETPWWYLAIEEMNIYFDQFNSEKPTEKEVIVISPMVPYLIDFYQTAEFSVLPLDQMQDFRSTKTEVWGENDYSDLLALYQQKIEEGHPVFVAEYGIGNEKPKQNSFLAIEEKFNLTKVHSGCHDLCDIYRIELKETNPNN